MGNHKAVIHKAVITFMGRSITSKFGVWLFKFMSIVVPLLPTFALVLYNGIQLESLITRSNLLQKSFEQVNSISLFWFESFAWISNFFLRSKMQFHCQFWLLVFKMKDTVWCFSHYQHQKVNDWIKGRWIIYNKCPITNFIWRNCKQRINEIMYRCFFFVAKEFWISVLNTYFHSVRYITENYGFVLYCFYTV